MSSPDNSTNESEDSPIFDEVSSSTASGGTKTTTTTTTVTESTPTDGEETDDDGEAEPSPDAPPVAKSYKGDVHRALERETQDGKGDDDPGPSDWAGYATEGVEVEGD